MPSKQLTHEDHVPHSAKLPLCLLAHDIESPANIGSFFRIADALGLEMLYLSGKSLQPPNVKIKKTSRSSEKYVPYRYSSSPLEVIEKLKQQDYRIISLEICDNSLPLASLQLNAQEKICLILGSENSGVDNSLLSLSDNIVHIPMRGNNSSMNVANACAIAAYSILEKIGLT